MGTMEYFWQEMQSRYTRENGVYPKDRVDVYGTMITLTIMKYYYIFLACYRGIKHAPTKNNTDWEKQGAWLFSFSF